MVPVPSSGPFRSGGGRTPPCLAGREREQSWFRETLGALERREPPPAAGVILYGPQGNGKTALLAWLQREAASRRKVESLRLSASDFRTSAELADLVHRPPWWQRFAPEELTAYGVGWKASRARASSLREALAARASRRPFALLVDSAHRLDRKTGHELLHASRQIGTEVPFLLVLAGAPDLPGHLETMVADSSTRFERWPIGLLAPDAAAEALCRPLETAGFSVAEDALSRLVRATDGHPYLIQLCGRAVWRRAREARPDDAPTVTPVRTEEAEIDFEREKNAHYWTRLRDLEDRDLAAVGKAVATAFQGRNRLGDDEVEAAILDGLTRTSAPGGAPAAEGALERLGILWRQRGKRDWEPGIPSLLDYIASEGGAYLR